jgi:hypothetical protein
MSMLVQHRRGHHEQVYQNDQYAEADAKLVSEKKVVDYQ